MSLSAFAHWQRADVYISKFSGNYPKNCCKLKNFCNKSVVFIVPVAFDKIHDIALFQNIFFFFFKKRCFKFEKWNIISVPLLIYYEIQRNELYNICLSVYLYIYRMMKYRLAAIKKSPMCIELFPETNYLSRLYWCQGHAEIWNCLFTLSLTSNEFDFPKQTWPCTELDLKYVREQLRKFFIWTNVTKGAASFDKFVWPYKSLTLHWVWSCSKHDFALSLTSHLAPPCTSLTSHWHWTHRDESGRFLKS